MSKQGVKKLLFFKMQKVTSSDQNYISQRKEKNIFWGATE